MLQGVGRVNYDQLLTSLTFSKPECSFQSSSSLSQFQLLSLREIFGIKVLQGILIVLSGESVQLTLYAKS